MYTIFVNDQRLCILEIDIIENEIEPTKNFQNTLVKLYTPDNNDVIFLFINVLAKFWKEYFKTFFLL